MIKRIIVHNVEPEGECEVCGKEGKVLVTELNDADAKLAAKLTNDQELIDDWKGDFYELCYECASKIDQQ